MNRAMDRNTVWQLMGQFRESKGGHLLTRQELFDVPHWDPVTLDAALDILVWAGTIKQSDDGGNPTTKYYLV